MEPSQSHTTTKDAPKNEDAIEQIRSALAEVMLLEGLGVLSKSAITTLSRWKERLDTAAQLHK